MPPRRVRFTIRGLMIAVLAVAISLCMPPAVPIFLLLVLQLNAMTLAPLILVFAGLAPSGRRIEATYRAMALYPLVLAGVLMLLGVAMMAVGLLD
jgi:hypothetical protein